MTKESSVAYARLQMNRRLLTFTCAVALLVAAPAAADLGDRKQTVDSRIATLNDRLAHARAREQNLSSEIAKTTRRIRELEARVGDVSQQLRPLQTELALRRARSEKLNNLFDLQTRQLHSLQRQHQYAVARLNARLVDIYEADTASTIDVLLSTASFSELVDKVEYTNMIAEQDARLAAEVERAKRQVAGARVKTKKLHAAATSETQVIAFRLQQVDALRTTLAATAGNLSSARSEKQQALTDTKQSERAWVAENDALRSVSANLAAQIQAASRAAAAAQAASAGADTTPAPSVAPGGFIWPVRGVITSPYGMRWGSLHPGIDIGAGTGTPIVASAPGRVLIASYDGGYGNLVVLDNGNGTATAYAHQSSIAVAAGQDVSQGQVIGYVGSTGFSTGPHLHFEIRINGSPVDPMGYL